ncbi:protein kinase [Streptomyces sp. NBC_00347]|nr:protein kinase [Streptomyces sp. NBC_00347]MCX5125484.1 protein kinase [Streptomyces sp. NBC_00347]
MAGHPVRAGQHPSRAHTRPRQIKPGNLLTFAAATAHALACIHAAGIAHRDLKPPNVILAADGPRVVDFGIAHLLDATAVTATRVNTGTRGWMAPEQLRTGVTTTASDVYAWGVLVAFAASGKHPYGPPTGIEFRMERGDAYTLEDIPEKLVEQVHAALQMDPKARPLAADLADTVAGMYGPQGTSVFPTMEFTRVADFSGPDYELFPPLSRWDIPAPFHDLTRDFPAPSAPAVPPIPDYHPAPQIRPFDPKRGIIPTVGAYYGLQTAQPAPSAQHYPPAQPQQPAPAPNPPVRHNPAAWAQSQRPAPKPYRTPQAAGGRPPKAPMPFMSKVTLTTVAVALLIAWSTSYDDGTEDTAQSQPTASASPTRTLAGSSGSNDPGYVSPYTPPPTPSVSPTPTPTMELVNPTPSPTPSPTASASPSGIYPETDRKDMVFAEETGRDKESILFDPNPQPSEFHSYASCGMGFATPSDEEQRKCTMNITNGTRGPVALVCTIPYRDDLSGNEDFREGDPQPDTGTMTFMTPVVPARYNMGVEFSLPKGKYRSLGENKTVCEFAKV